MFALDQWRAQVFSNTEGGKDIFEKKKNEQLPL